MKLKLIGFVLWIAILTACQATFESGLPVFNTAVRGYEVCVISQVHNFVEVNSDNDEWELIASTINIEINNQQLPREAILITTYDVGPSFAHVCFDVQHLEPQTVNEGSVLISTNEDNTYLIVFEFVVTANDNQPVVILPNTASILIDN